MLWAVTPEGRANNLGEDVLDRGESELKVTTEALGSRSGRLRTTGRAKRAVKLIAMMAREAVQTAEDARIIAFRRARANKRRKTRSATAEEVRVAAEQEASRRAQAEADRSCSRARQNGGRTKAASKPARELVVSGEGVTPSQAQAPGAR